MLDSAANLLIRLILRDGGKIDTTKTQDDLLCNTLAHLWSASGKLANAWRETFSEIQRTYTLTSGWKYNVGYCLIMQIFN